MAQLDEGDDDLKLIRASAWAIESLKNDLPKFVQMLQRFYNGEITHNSHLISHQADKIHRKFNIFQEDPLVLDPHLKNFMQMLGDSFLLFISGPSTSISLDTRGEALEALSLIIYTLCKVRGVKVITNLLNNEPKYLSDILQAFQFTPGIKVAPSEPKEALFGSDAADIAEAIRASVQWMFRHILLLWTSHLMLTPFDLSTVAAAPALRFLARSTVNVKDYPDAARQALQVAFLSITSATNEQSAAALLLARISLRPDMVKQGLLDTTVVWATQACLNDDPNVTVYELTGPLNFLGKIVSMSDSIRVAPYIDSIYQTTLRMLGEDGNQTAQTSAVTKQLIIKIQRHLILHLLHLNSLGQGAGRVVAQRMLEELSVLEDVVDFFLRSLADRDTLVRMAASKSISVVAAQLESEMCEEVVEAVLGSLQEDVLDTAAGKSLSAVNPVRWHGLVLTLAHMLFRQSASAAQLGRVLDALYLALTFEQRSATGNSLGGNVRDAANFGLWSLARRYTTVQICNASNSSEGERQEYKVLQDTVGELLKAATLDPVGNVRRGSSAALQELVGRHSDTIIQGISLIQIVDFHAVGLASRAMIQVSLAASKLDVFYRDAALSALMEWRGVFSPDTVSRQNAANAMGGFTKLLSNIEFGHIAKRLMTRIASLEDNEIEERHGLFLMLARMVASATSIDPELLSQILQVLDNPSLLEEQDLTRASQRPQLSIEAILAMFEAFSVHVSSVGYSWGKNALDLLSLCVKHVQEDNLGGLAQACQRVLPTMTPEICNTLVTDWLKGLSNERRSVRPPGASIAIGAAYQVVTIQRTAADTPASLNGKELRSAIVDTLVDLSEKKHTIETRVVAVRSMAQLIKDKEAQLEPQEVSSILGALLASLNDYTINERGDVGSLLRSKAIQITELAGLDAGFQNDKLLQNCLLSVVRLAFEKFDRIRLEAAKCLSTLQIFNNHSIRTLTDVSTVDYFFKLAATLPKTSLNRKDQVTDQTLIEALMEGFVSSAGGGSDSIMPLARTALFNILDALPDKAASADQHDYKSLDLITATNALLNVFQHNVSNDRVLVPLLETTSFLFDTGIMERLQHHGVEIKWRNMLSFVQKSHFKTSNMQKIIAAVGVYRGMVDVPSVRKDVLTKLISMLAHPFPKVREAAAETLFVVTAEQEIKGREWNAPVHKNNDLVLKLKSNLVAT